MAYRWRSLLAMAVRRSDKNRGSRRDVWTPSRIPRNAELLHQLVKRRPTDAKFHGGGSNLPSVTPQGVLDHFPLDALARLLERLRRQGAQGIGQLQVPGGDALPIRHNDRPLHPVLQLPDVSRPTVKTQGAQRVGREG